MYEVMQYDLSYVASLRLHTGNKLYVAALRHVHHTPGKTGQFTSPRSSSFITVQTAAFKVIHFHSDTGSSLVSIIYHFRGGTFLP